MKTDPAKNHKVTFPIGWKLMAMMVAMLASGMTAVVFLATQAYLRDSLSFIQKSESDLAGQLAGQVREQLQNLSQQVALISQLEKSQAAKLFQQYPEIEAFSLWSLGKSSPDRLDFGLGFDSKSKAARALVADLKPATRAFDGLPEVERRSHPSGQYILLSIPITGIANNQITRVASALIRAETLLGIFKKKGVFTSYLVHRSGQLLGHSSPSLIASNPNFKDLDVVKAMFTSPLDNGQGEFTEGGVAYLKAFKKINAWDVGVVSMIPKRMATATIERVQSEAIWVTGIVLSLAIGLISFFATTLTRPIRELVVLSGKISKGDFGVQIHHQGRDEVALLTRSFGEMAKGLAERERIKSAFQKYHSEEIAERILNSDLSLGGVRHEASILFCDIRGFTDFSEKHSATEVVEMLNEYFGVLVGAIRQNRGLIDKFIGDAVLAVWGAPVTNPDHASDAVRAAIAMRNALADLNIIRTSRGQTAIKMGIGIHSGDLIAGNIGSVDRMEHTVIGDTVNIASRLEGITKTYDTDIIISESVLRRCEGLFATEPLPPAQLKGKADLVNIYKVIGYQMVIK